MTSRPGAFEILRTTRQFPVVEKETASAKCVMNAVSERSMAGAAWGKSTRKWVAVSSTSSCAREFGDAMPHVLRTLVAASFDVFVNAQTHHTGVLGVLCASREYRDALKTCIFALEDCLKMQTNQESNEKEESEFLDLLKISLAMWHLCELLLLRGEARGADKTLAYDVARWLQEHYCSALHEKSDSESERLKKAQKPEQDTAFWTTIQSLVMMGNGPSAWSLLASHSRYKSLLSRETMSMTGASMKTSFQLIHKLLVTIPGRTSAYSDQDAPPDEWKNWNDACQYLLNTDGYIKANDGLKTLLQIMAAKEDVLKSHATAWYELMMARLFLEEPKTIAHRFQFLMRNCFHAYNSDETQMSNFDGIILAIMEHNIQSALQDIIALGFSWMAAHLTDLLQKSNVIVADAVLPHAECSLRERFLLEYAMEIGASSGMWQFVVQYYEHCPQFGAIAIQCVLKREPLLTDYKAERLLAYCRGKKLLTQSSRQISIQRAQECKTNKAYASALQWLLRSNCLDDVDALCDEVLKECIDRNSWTSLHEAVQFLEARSELARPQKLAWLVRYREFHLVLDDRESLQTQLKCDKFLVTDSNQENASLERKYRFVSMEAAKRLGWLFSSAETPEVLQSELFQQAESLLKESPTVFGSQHLYSLMAYLQQLDRSFDRQQFYNVSSNKQLKERIESLVCRNLTEAMLHEATANGCGATTASRQPNAAYLPQPTHLIANAMKE